MRILAFVWGHPPLVAGHPRALEAPTHAHPGFGALVASGSRVSGIFGEGLLQPAGIEGSAASSVKAPD